MSKYPLSCSTNFTGKGISAELLRGDLIKELPDTDEGSFQFSFGCQASSDFDWFAAFSKRHLALLLFLRSCVLQ